MEKKKKTFSFFEHFILHCVKSIQIRGFFWSVLGHFSRSVIVLDCDNRIIVFAIILRLLGILNIPVLTYVI